MHQTTGEEVDLVEYLQDNPDASDASLQARYKLATLGYVRDVFGWVWDRCPRFYTRSDLVDKQTWLESTRILRKRGYVADGALPYSELTTRERDLITMARSLRSYIQDRRREDAAA